MKHWSKSKTLWASLVLFIIGLESFVPQIKEVLPEPYGKWAALVIPLVIMWFRVSGIQDRLTTKTPRRRFKG